MLKDGEKGAILQRDKASYAVAPHIPCGVTTPKQLKRIAEVAEKHNVAALKITSASRIAMVGIPEEQLDDIWKDLDMNPGAAVGQCIRSIKACPGTTFCKRGIRDSLGMGMKLDEIYHGMELPGKLKMGVSGCAQQCAETCIKDISLVASTKGWKILVGGNGGPKPRLAQELATNLSDEEALALIEKIIEYFKANAQPRRRLGAMLEEIGFEKFASDILQ